MKNGWKIDIFYWKMPNFALNCLWPKIAFYLKPYLVVLLAMLKIQALKEKQLWWKQMTHCQLLNYMSLTIKNKDPNSSWVGNYWIAHVRALKRQVILFVNKPYEGQLSDIPRFSIFKQVYSKHDFLDSL